MAQVYPNFKVIMEAKQKPTEGELFLLKNISEKFDSEVEVYFQPFFNGERPDIIIAHKWKGIIIIEVKDWDLSSYYLDEQNKWHVRCSNKIIRSPFEQVFNYKTNMFNLHINGLYEKNLKDSNFYSAVKCYVYFHKATKNSLENFYSNISFYYKDLAKECNAMIVEHNGDKSQYYKKLDYIRKKEDQIKRDLKYISITSDNIDNIKFPFKSPSAAYPLEVYEGFLRYLNPPHHYSSEGKEIAYSEPQKKLSISTSGAREKIKGVAGSGKTTVLAKRAVNSHKRHGCEVLILTFNLTLKMFVKERINEVREDFSWGVFSIINYHSFISMALNKYGIKIEIPDDLKKLNNKDKITEYLENEYYSNENVFDAEEITKKYKTILIDEIQDYKPEWIKIIRKFFLDTDGEMVLFGDEKQNIYEREIDSDKTTKIVHGFGRWSVLKKSYRFKEDSHILNLAKRFQSSFFTDRYDADFDDASQPSLLGLGVNQCLCYSKQFLVKIIEYVFLIARRELIHPNDIVILSSNIAQMRDIDHLIRKNPAFNEKTLTTFETKEMYDLDKESRHDTDKTGRSEKSALNKNRYDIEKIRKIKKFGFNQNSGVLKVSTIHSYKGYESPTVFLIINEEDSPELVYVGITRARFNLVIFFQENSKYTEFFKKNLEFVEIYEDTKNAE